MRCREDLVGGEKKIEAFLTDLAHPHPDAVAVAARSLGLVLET